MVSRNVYRRAGVLAAAAIAVFLAGCASDAAVNPQEAPSEEPTSSSEDSSSGEYAFGTDRDQIAQAIEAAFSSENGVVSWNGDTLVLSVDGDADAAMAGFTQCRVLSHLVVDGDATAIAFPNGNINCAEALAEE